MTTTLTRTFPTRRDGKRFYGVRETPKNPTYSQIPRRRCGHLACGTYCTLASDPFTDKGPCHRSSKTFEYDPPAKTRKRPVSSMDQHLCGGRCSTIYGGLSEEPEVKFPRSNIKGTELDWDTLEIAVMDFPLLRPEELKEKLRVNPLYLMEQVCRALQKVDKYSRGIVRATTFARVLRCFGAHPPMPEISEILSYCILTKDGFVVFKPLIIRVTPEKVPGFNDQVKNHLNPPEIWNKDIYIPACPKKFLQHPYRSILPPNEYGSTDENGNSLTGKVAQQLEEKMKLDINDQTEKGIDWSTEKTPPWKFEIERDPLGNPQLTPAKSDAIRRLFAMWDRCLINDDTLKLHIKLLGLPITREAEYLLTTHTGARSLSFGKFLSALQIDDLTSSRRNRAIAPYLAGWLEYPPATRFSGRQLFEAKDEPISWRCRFPLTTLNPMDHSDDNKTTGYASLRWTSDRHRVPKEETSVSLCDVSNIDPNILRKREIRQLVLDAASGTLHPLVLRGYLDRYGITITPEIDRSLNELELVGTINHHEIYMHVCRAPGFNDPVPCFACKDMD